jgi:hypothetical protein
VCALPSHFLLPGSCCEGIFVSDCNDPQVSVDRSHTDKALPEGGKNRRARATLLDISIG